jgi:hypothetical protein
MKNSQKPNFSSIGNRFKTEHHLPIASNSRHLKVGQWRELFYRVYGPGHSSETNQSIDNKNEQDGTTDQNPVH